MVDLTLELKREDQREQKTQCTMLESVSTKKIFILYENVHINVTQGRKLCPAPAFSVQSPIFQAEEETENCTG